MLFWTACVDLAGDEDALATALLNHQIGKLFMYVTQAMRTDVVVLSSLRTIPFGQQ